MDGDTASLSTEWHHQATTDFDHSKGVLTIKLDPSGLATPTPPPIGKAKVLGVHTIDRRREEEEEEDAAATDKDEGEDEDEEGEAADEALPSPPPPPSPSPPPPITSPPPLPPKPDGVIITLTVETAHVPQVSAASVLWRRLCMRVQCVCGGGSGCVCACMCVCGGSGWLCACLHALGCCSAAAAQLPTPLSRVSLCAVLCYARVRTQTAPVMVGCAHVIMPPRPSTLHTTHLPTYTHTATALTATANTTPSK